MVARTAYATVSTASPLTVLFDADPINALPAEYLSTYVPTAGDRVRVEIRRSGLLPIVTGKVA